MAPDKSIVKALLAAILNTVVQSIEPQGNRGGTGKSRQNSRGTGISKLAGAAPLLEAPPYPIVHRLCIQTWWFFCTEMRRLTILTAWLVRT